MARARRMRGVAALTLGLVVLGGCASITREQREDFWLGDQTEYGNSGFLSFVGDILQEVFYPPTELRGERKAYPWEP